MSLRGAGGDGAVIRGNDGFGDIFAGEAGADGAVAGVKDKGGDFI